MMPSSVVAELEDKIANETLLEQTPSTRKSAPKELQDLHDQIDRLNKALNEARRAEEAPKREAERAAKELQDAKDHVADLEKKLSTGELDTEKRPPKPISPELQAEREKAKELNQKIAEARKLRDTYTPITPEQRVKALDAILKRQQKQLDEFDRRKREGDFSKVERKPAPSSKETRKPRPLRSAKPVRSISILEKAARLAKRTGTEKFSTTWFVGNAAWCCPASWFPFKLGAAVQTRAFHNHHGGTTDPWTGAKFSRRRLVEQAKLEGHGNVSGFAKAYVKAMGKWMNDAKDIIKTGKTDIDILHGPHRGDQELGLDSVLGRIHYAIKAPAKRAAFDHAAEKLTDAERAAGNDPADDDVKLRIINGAYQAAERAIFAQDSGYCQGVPRVPEHSGKERASRCTARLLRILFPIVKIPLNMVSEASQYAGGVPMGLYNLGKVWKRGMQSVTEEEANLIMRQLKKGMLGNALMALGYFAAGSVGGFYQDKEKRKLGEPKAGGVKVAGVDIPAVLMHSPAFQILQMGATIRRVADARSKAGKGDGIPAGLGAGIFGVLSETPFINEMTRMSQLQSTEGQRTIWRRSTQEPSHPTGSSANR